MGHVRLYDTHSNLAIVKTTRENTPIFCESLHLLNAIKNNNIYGCVLSIHGSSRTARKASLKLLRSYFNHLFKDHSTLILTKKRQIRSQNIQKQPWNEYIKIVDKINLLV